MDQDEFRAHGLYLKPGEGDELGFAGITHDDSAWARNPYLLSFLPELAGTYSKDHFATCIERMASLLFYMNWQEKNHRAAIMDVASSLVERAVLL